MNCYEMNKQLESSCKPFTSFELNRDDMLSVNDSTLGDMTDVIRCSWSEYQST